VSGPDWTDPEAPGALGHRLDEVAGTRAFDVESALRDLDRATRTFVERLESGEPAAPAPTAVTSPAGPPVPPLPVATDPMREAEQEAARYLGQAKRRADGLVAAMLSAVERDVLTMHREAENEIQARREAVEVDAARRLEEARIVAERIVAERQRRIAELSDGISGRARALAAGMEDAERIRAQFEGFVVTLSAAARRVAAIGSPRVVPHQRAGELPARDDIAA
jgi:hypothetical protein